MEYVAKLYGHSYLGRICNAEGVCCGMQDNRNVTLYRNEDGKGQFGRERRHH